MCHQPLDIRWLVEELEARYGPPPAMPRFEPMDELVSCILSQHTSDANSLPAFYKLKASFPTWESVLDAAPHRIAEAIRGAGLANQKTRSIQGALKAIKERTGTVSISHLAKLPMREARAWLEGLPGVGPKTASIVLCFAFAMEAIPVDTHVHRVAKRLALIPIALSAERAHDVLLEVVPPGLGYRFHMALIHLGRAVCRAPKPRCSQCILHAVCPSSSSKEGKKS